MAALALLSAVAGLEPLRGVIGGGLVRRACCFLGHRLHGNGGLVADVFLQTIAQALLPYQEALIARAHLADADLKGKCRMILALADDDAANANYLALSGAQIAVEIAITGSRDMAMASAS